MKYRFAATVAIILLVFGASWYLYARSLPAVYLEWDDLIRIETNKETIRKGETVRVTVYLSNPYFRTAKYPYFTSYGLDANYEGSFNEALLGGVQISPASDWYTLSPFGREYFVRNRAFTVDEVGEFFIIFKLSGRETVTREKVVLVN